MPRGSSACLTARINPDAGAMLQGHELALAGANAMFAGRRAIQRDGAGDEPVIDRGSFAGHFRRLAGSMMSPTWKLPSPTCPTMVT